MWLGAEASYNIDRRWGADLEIGGRLEDGLRSFDRYDAALGFDFKATKWLKFGAGYDLIRDYNPGETEVLYKTNDDGTYRLDSDGNRIVKGVNCDDAFWRTKHRVYFDATFKGKVGRLGISLRERYQLTRFAPAEVTEWKFREEYALEEMPYFQSRLSSAAMPAAASAAAMPPAGTSSRMSTAEAIDNLKYFLPTTGDPAPFWDHTFYGPLVGDDGETYYYALDDEKSGRDTKDGKERHYLRSRLALDYNIRRCPLTPFTSYELTLDLGRSFDVVRHRFQAGFDVSLTKDKRHALSVAYLYQHGAREEVGTADIHALTLGYKLSLDSPRAAAQKAAAKKAKKKAKKGGK